MLSINQRLDIAFKKMMGVSPTDSSALKEYFLEPTSPTIIDGNNVFIERTALPALAPVGAVGDKFKIDGTLTTGVDAVVQKISEVSTVVPGKPEAFYLVSGKVLPFNFKVGAYAPRFFDQSGNEIPFGSNDLFFDADSGVLVFMAGLPAGVTSVRVDGWRYVGKTVSELAASMIPHYHSSYSLASDNLPAGVGWVLADKKFIVTHNLNSSKYTIQLLFNNVEFFTKVEISNNTTTVWFEDVILATHNVILKIINHI